jgi:hypothetical protein
MLSTFYEIVKQYDCFDASLPNRAEAPNIAGPNRRCYTIQATRGAIVYRLGHRPFKAERRVRLPLALLIFPIPVSFVAALLGIISATSVNSGSRRIK